MSLYVDVSSFDLSDQVKTAIIRCCQNVNILGQVRIQKEFSNGFSGNRVFLAAISDPAGGECKIIFKYGNAKELHNEVFRYSKLKQRISHLNTFVRIRETDKILIALEKLEGHAAIVYEYVPETMAATSALSLSELIREHIMSGDKLVTNDLLRSLESVMISLRQLANYQCAKQEFGNAISRYYLSKWIPNYMVSADRLLSVGKKKLLTINKYNENAFSLEPQKTARELASDSEKPTSSPSSLDLAVDDAAISRQNDSIIILTHPFPEDLVIKIDITKLNAKNRKQLHSISHVCLWSTVSSTRYALYERRLASVFHNIDLKKEFYSIANNILPNPMLMISRFFLEGKRFIPDKVMLTPAHGDLHPGNILCVGSTPVIIDYGLAEMELPQGTDVGRLIGGCIRDTLSEVLDLDGIVRVLACVLCGADESSLKTDREIRACLFMKQILEGAIALVGSRELVLIHCYGYAWLGLKWERSSIRAYQASFVIAAFCLKVLKLCPYDEADFQELSSSYSQPGDFRKSCSKLSELKIAQPPEHEELVGPLAKRAYAALQHSDGEAVLAIVRKTFPALTISQINHAYQIMQQATDLVNPAVLSAVERLCLIICCLTHELVQFQETALVDDAQEPCIEDESVVAGKIDKIVRELLIGLGTQILSRIRNTILAVLRLQCAEWQFVELAKEFSWETEIEPAHYVRPRLLIAFLRLGERLDLHSARQCEFASYLVQKLKSSAKVFDLHYSKERVSEYRVGSDSLRISIEYVTPSEQKFWSQWFSSLREDIVKSNTYVFERRLGEIRIPKPELNLSASIQSRKSARSLVDDITQRCSAANVVEISRVAKKKFIPTLYVERDVQDQIQEFVPPDEKLTAQLNQIRTRLLRGAIKSDHDNPQQGRDGVAEQLSTANRRLFSDIEKSLDEVVAESRPCDAHLRNVYKKLIDNLTTLDTSISGTIQSAIDLINKHTVPFICIVDRAGGGKTNLLCHMAQSRGQTEPTIFLGGRIAIEKERDLLIAILERVGWTAAENIDNFLEKLNSSLSIARMTLTVLIDGINENRDIRRLNRALDFLAEKSSQCRIKVILTCRDIYWKFFESSKWCQKFSTVIRGGLREFTASEYGIALEKYLNHYRIDVRLGRDAFARCRHPLLLRFFCEAYAPKSGHVNSLGQIDEIRLKPLFDQYWMRKVAEPGIWVENGNYVTLENSIVLVTKFMISNAVASINTDEFIKATGVLDLTSEQSPYIRLLDEDIIIDELPTNALSVRRVVFVYEEFMEYAIAKALFNELPEPRSKESLLALVESLIAKSDKLVNVLGVAEYVCAFCLDSGLSEHFVTLLLRIAREGGAWCDILANIFAKYDAALDAFVGYSLGKSVRGKSVIDEMLDLLGTNSPDEMIDLSIFLALKTLLPQVQSFEDVRRERAFPEVIDKADTLITQQPKLVTKIVKSIARAFAKYSVNPARNTYWRGLANNRLEIGGSERAAFLRAIYGILPRVDRAWVYRAYACNGLYDADPEVRCVAALIARDSSSENVLLLRRNLVEIERDPKVRDMLQG